MGSFFFVENNEDHLIVKLVFEDHLGYHLNHLWCTPIDTGEHIPIERDNLSSFVFDSVMFIPINTFEDEVIRYTLIGKSWQVRHYDGSFSLPKISPHCLRQL